jgi:hypothetical protein
MLWLLHFSGGSISKFFKEMATKKGLVQNSDSEVATWRLKLTAFNAGADPATDNLSDMISLTLSSLGHLSLKDSTMTSQSNRRFVIEGFGLSSMGMLSLI